MSHLYFFPDQAVMVCGTSYLHPKGQMLKLDFSIKVLINLCKRRKITKHSN
jgi:hypothetical protein